MMRSTKRYAITLTVNILLFLTVKNPIAEMLNGSLTVSKKANLRRRLALDMTVQFIVVSVSANAEFWKCAKLMN